MNELIKINIETSQPTVSARELHEGLEIKSNFTTWFERMVEYGFTEADYKKCFPNLESGCNGGQNMVDYDISVDMAKQICMIQRSEKGKQYRQYFLELEKAWNSPGQVMARALKMADKTITGLQADVNRMKPKEVFADARWRLHLASGLSRRRMRIGDIELSAASTSSFCSPLLSPIGLWDMW